MRCNTKHNIPTARVTVRGGRILFIRGRRWALITRGNTSNWENKWLWGGGETGLWKEEEQLLSKKENDCWFAALTQSLPGTTRKTLAVTMGTRGSRWKLLSGRVMINLIKAFWYRNKSRLMGLNWSRLDWSICLHSWFFLFTQWVSHRLLQGPEFLRTSTDPPHLDNNFFSL